MMMIAHIILFPLWTPSLRTKLINEVTIRINWRIIIGSTKLQGMFANSIFIFPLSFRMLDKHILLLPLLLSSRCKLTVKSSVIYCVFILFICHPNCSVLIIRYLIVRLPLLYVGTFYVASVGVESLTEVSMFSFNSTSSLILCHKKNTRQSNLGSYPGLIVFLSLTLIAVKLYPWFGIATPLPDAPVKYPEFQQDQQWYEQPLKCGHEPVH